MSETVKRKPKAVQQAVKSIQSARGLVPGVGNLEVPVEVRENLRRELETRLDEALAFLGAGE